MNVLATAQAVVSYRGVSDLSRTQSGTLICTSLGGWFSFSVDKSHFMLTLQIAKIMSRVFKKRPRGFKIANMQRERYYCVRNKIGFTTHPDYFNMSVS